MRRHLLIVGGGIAAHRLIAELLERGADGRAITLMCGEPHLPYDRVRLGDVLDGRAGADQLALAPAAWYRERGVTVHLGTAVTALDRHARAVTLSGGRRLCYDRLVLATGSEAVSPAIPGVHHPGVLTYRTLDDARRLATAGPAVVVIGGGLLGIEAACSFRSRGRKVTLVHRGAWLLDRQIDPETAALLQRELEARGLVVVTGANVVEIQKRRERRSVRLGDGRTLGADAVVLATGARPACRLARAAGLACARGIVVDDRLRSSDRRILALGECAEHPHATHGFVQPVHDQAAVLARRLTGDRSAFYQGTVTLATLKVDGLALASAGRAAGERLELRDPGRGVSRRLFVAGGRLRGAVLYGDGSDGVWFAELIRRQTPIAAIRGELIFGRLMVEVRHGRSVLGPPIAGPAPAEERLAA